MGATAADLQTIENAWTLALDREYVQVVNRIKAMAPPGGLWSDADLQGVIEFATSAERFFETSYEDCAAYLAANSHPELQARLFRVLSDIRGMLPGLKDQLDSPPPQTAAAQQKIDSSKREATDFCNAIFAPTTRRKGDAWQNWLGDWHRATFPSLPPRPNVCPYCNRVYGITHSRAVCPVYHRIIWS